MPFLHVHPGPYPAHFQPRFSRSPEATRVDSHRALASLCSAAHSVGGKTDDGVIQEDTCQCHWACVPSMISPNPCFIYSWRYMAWNRTLLRCILAALPLPTYLAEENSVLTWFSVETQDKPHLILFIIYFCPLPPTLKRKYKFSGFFCGGFCLGDLVGSEGFWRVLSPT